MNIQLSSQLFLGNTASLAGIAIALACLAALLVPRRAVIRYIATTPVYVCLTSGGLRLRYALASLGAKVSAFGVGLFHLKVAPADWALKRDTLSEGQIRTSNFGAWDSLTSSRQPLPIAFRRTEVVLRLLNLVMTLVILFPTLLTSYFKIANSFCIFTKIARTKSAFRKAFRGTKLARPTSMMPKLITTLRAVHPDTGGFLLALAGTETGVSAPTSTTIFTFIHESHPICNFCSLAQKRRICYGRR
jgi:hypothetical protein